jgi:hypothetical protein
MWYHYLFGLILLSLIAHSIYVQLTQHFSSTTWRIIYLIMPVVYSSLFYYFVYIPLKAPPTSGARRY